VARMKYVPVPGLRDKVLEAAKPKLDPYIRELKGELDAELNATIGQLAREMSGHPAEQVLPELRARILDLMPARALNHEKVRALAAHISGGPPGQPRPSRPGVGGSGLRRVWLRGVRPL
jgi:hypothetical protein